MRRVFAVLVVVFQLLLISPIASAVESNGIGGRPANPVESNPRTKSIFVYDLKPGQSVNDAVAVYNNSSDTKTIGVYAVDGLISSDGAFGCRQEVEEKKEVGSWIQVQSNEVSVPAGGNAKVPFTLKVPADTPAGEYNACIAIQDRTSEPQKQGNGISLSFRSAIRVAVTIPGDIQESLSLVDSLLVVKNDKLNVSPMLKNDGNVSVDSKISVKIKTIFGTTIDDVSGEFPVLAKSEARFNFDLSRPFWGGFYFQETNASYKRLSQANSQPKDIAGIKDLRFIMPKPLALAVEILVLTILVVAIKKLISARKSNKTLQNNLFDYKVKKGEHIEEIAQSNDIEWKKLARINKLSAPYKLEPGQILKVPKATHDGAKNSANKTKHEAPQEPKATVEKRETTGTKTVTKKTSKKAKNKAKTKKTSTKSKSKNKKVASQKTSKPSSTTKKTKNSKK